MTATPQFRAGEELGLIVRTIEQAQLNAFAEVGGSDGPMHTDPDYANARYGSTVVQGMLLVDAVSELMIAACAPEGWMRHGKLEVKFVAPTHVGDTVVTRVIVEEVSEDSGWGGPGVPMLTCSFTCETQDGRTVVVGTARGALLPEDGE